VHAASCNRHSTPCTLHPAPWVSLPPGLYTLHPIPSPATCTFHLALCTVHPASCILHPASCPYTLHPKDWTLQPAACTLHLAPCTLHPPPSLCTLPPRQLRTYYGRQKKDSGNLSFVFHLSACHFAPTWPIFVFLNSWCTYMRGEPDSVIKTCTCYPGTLHTRTVHKKSRFFQRFANRFWCLLAWTTSKVAWGIFFISAPFNKLLRERAKNKNVRKRSLSTPYPPCAPGCMYIVKCAVMQANFIWAKNCEKMKRRRRKMWEKINIPEGHRHMLLRILWQPVAWRNVKEFIKYV
jgi:hypothetical protein